MLHTYLKLNIVTENHPNRGAISYSSQTNDLKFRFCNKFYKFMKFIKFWYQFIKIIFQHLSRALNFDFSLMTFLFVFCLTIVRLARNMPFIYSYILTYIHTHAAQHMWGLLRLGIFSFNNLCMYNTNICMAHTAYAWFSLVDKW